jgi:thiamine-phosphate pyrophosphorylase
VFRLYLITDRRRMKPDPAQALESALSGLPPGAAAVQLRERDLDARQLFELGRSLSAVCDRHQARLTINDRADVGLALGVGVHLRANSIDGGDARRLLGPKALIGCSAHGPEEVLAATGADFATIGPVFDTPSKRELGTPIGLEGITRAAAASPLPLFALGGIDLHTGRLALAAGAQGLAAIRAIWDGKPASQTARFWSILNR